jgi:hypothetical protein
MHRESCRTGLDEELATALVSAARTGLGDELRSVLYFTPGAFDVPYVRSDLYEDVEAARAAKEQLVELERVGFAEAPVRTAIAGSQQPAIGPYAFTVRFHENGFVVRVLGPDAGVLLTTDSMNVAGFREAATALGRLLAGSD